MNQEARDRLVEAELQGVEQIRGTFAIREGRCALGVLGFGLEGSDPLALLSKYEFSEKVVACPFVGTNLEMNICYPRSEAMLVAHLNDTHKLSFLDIARKFPESIDG